MSGQRVLFLGDIVGEPGRTAVSTHAAVADRAPPARPRDRERRERRRRPRHHPAHRGQAARRGHRRAHDRQPRLPAPRRLRATSTAATGSCGPPTTSSRIPARGHTVHREERRALGGREPQRQRLHGRGALAVPRRRPPARAAARARPTTCSSTSTPRRPARRSRWAGTSTAACSRWSGTHTHVPTADGRVLPGGTAFISDVGMTGARGGVIGVKKEQILERFLTQMPVKFETADRRPVGDGGAWSRPPTTGSRARSSRSWFRPRMPRCPDARSRASSAISASGNHHTM